MWFLKRGGLRLIASCLVTLNIGVATASESLTELPTGGIDFVKASDPTALVLQSEEVTFSPAKARFYYDVANKGAVPLELVLGFRLPDLDFSDPDTQYAIPGSDPVNFLGASFTIDGKAAPFSMTQRASLKGKDVTDLLRQTKLALAPLGVFQNELTEAPQDLRDKLIEQGLVVESGTSVDGKPLFFPSWTVKTNSTRKIVIPPLQSVKIELRYLTSLGSSPDTVLRKALRDQKGLGAEVNGKRATYCVDDGFLNGLDKLTGAEEANASGVREIRIHLLNKQSMDHQLTAAHYKLIVDKESEKRIVSFCSENIKKISATMFEMRADNFLPSVDLRLIFIDKATQRLPNHP
jgi:hypothetical protein